MFQVKSSENLKSIISENQHQNIEKLIADVQNSTDTPISEVDFSQLKSTVKDALNDRSLTNDEVTAIVADTLDIVDQLGITPEEARIIYYDVQNIGEASRLPRSHDNLIGTSGNDVLVGKLGNDTLTGADAINAGVNEIDWLIGGGGSDTFVLGNASTVFYNDNNPRTSGTGDYAVIVDYNPDQDVIQLHGDASQYRLAAIPEGSGMNGTAILYQSGGLAAPELIGIVAGVTVNDFSTGFIFI